MALKSLAKAIYKVNSVDSTREIFKANEKISVLSIAGLNSGNKAVIDF